MCNRWRSQRGEGKFGCILTFLVVAIITAIGFKVVPIYYSNSELADACEFIASSASRLPAEQVEADVRRKAKELEIVEAVTDKNAIRVTKTVASEAGTCTIRLNYKRAINFYGLFKHTIHTDKTISRTIFTNI